MSAGDEVWAPEITADEFITGYSERSGVSPEWLALHGRATYPCNCRESGCEGWQMVNAAFFADELRLWEAGDGPHPSKLTAEEWAAWLAR